jgi:hypothetical protein
MRITMRGTEHAKKAITADVSRRRSKFRVIGARKRDEAISAACAAAEIASLRSQ